MVDRRHIENRILAISRRHICRLMRISELRWRITCRYRSHDQNCNFRKFKMADGCHFENSFISISQSWIVRFWSNLARSCKFPFRAWNLTKKNRNFSSSRWWTDTILIIFFGYILAAFWPINAKFGMEMTIHVQIWVTWPKTEIFPNSWWRTAAYFENSFRCLLILLMN